MTRIEELREQLEGAYGAMDIPGIRFAYGCSPHEIKVDLALALAEETAEKVAALEGELKEEIDEVRTMRAFVVAEARLWEKTEPVEESLDTGTAARIVDHVVSQGFAYAKGNPEPAPARWEPEEGEEFWHVRLDGSIGCDCFQPDYHNVYWQFGNCFKDRKAAGEASDAVRELLKGVRP